MSHQGQDNPGTGLRDVFDILVKAPPERLQSLTVQLGESPEDNIIHALCLVVLQREAQALNKFQMQGENRLANHLAEKLQMGGGNSEEFRDHCGDLQELTGETLAMLARIFKVLSEQRLCDPLLRNLAYQRALSTNGQKTSSHENLEFDQLREEAKDVCGPQFVEWMSTFYYDPHRSLDERNTTLKVTLHCHDQLARAHSLPTPLQACSSEPSYPTHLEISIPPTISFQEDKRIPETPDEPKLNTPILLLGGCEAKNAPEQSQTFEEPQSKSNEPTLFEAKKDSLIAAGFATERKESNSHTEKNTKPSTEIKFSLPAAANIFLHKTPVSREIHESEGAEAEEEATFYAFVILHAPQDADMAGNMKEKLEAVIGSEGAIFSDDFAIPGKSTLRCVEDAINNSAFTFLLLTRNFNTRMLEMKTNSALINSINKEHKYNTVIPLLPRENCMPRQNIPLVLLTLVPLEENKSFEKKIQKAMTPARIRQLKNIWTAEQRVKFQIERQVRLKQFNQSEKQLIQEYKRVQLLEEENRRLQNLLLDHSEHHGGDSQARWQQPANIHIENAQYIMIGNDSQMTVDTDGGADKNYSINKEKEK